ncbi:MAG: FHA domain-containing serine/threonine-protein kinase [Gemmataceae bacterium]
MGWRFLVVDGANQGQSFVLPLQGAVTIGRSQRHADIILHDLYVARVHCEVVVDGEEVLFRALPEAEAGLLVNGAKLKEGVLKSKDVLRLGNSHLRLEPYDHDHPDAEPAAEPEAVQAEEEVIEAVAVEDDEDAPAEAPPEPGQLPNVPLGRLKVLSGHTLSHYQLGKVLGQGHYGVVFHARHVTSGTELALKVLSAEFPQNPAEMKAFVAALKAILGKKHPNLVTLYNAGRTGPYCWLALEYVEGDSLADVLRDADPGRSYWRSALRLGIQLGRALEFLRKNRLVHGNISPANVLYNRDEDGREKEVKLGDLMLSRALHGSALVEAHREEKLEAELGYMAPEQLTQGAPIDLLTDLYGVGAVMYARLTAGPPFQGDSPAQTWKMVLKATPPKPSDFHENIPERLSAAVMLLLARYPEDRYQSPADLLADLEEVAQDEGVAV